MGSIPCMETKGFKAHCILQSAPILNFAGLDAYFLDESIVGARHPAPSQVLQLRKGQKSSITRAWQFIFGSSGNFLKSGKES